MSDTEMEKGYFDYCRLVPRRYPTGFLRILSLLLHKTLLRQLSRIMTFRLCRLTIVIRDTTITSRVFFVLNMLR